MQAHWWRAGVSDHSGFLSCLHQSIPLSAAMQIDDLQFDGQTLTLSAPLAPNINDKGTAFAAATSGLATLSGWALITLWLKSRGVAADVMIAKSEVRYLAPVLDRFCARVSLPDAQVLEQCWQRFEQQGRGRLSLQVELYSQGQTQLLLEGVYAMVRR